MRRKIIRKRFAHTSGNKVKLALLALVFLISLIILNQLISLINGLGAPFAPDSKIADSKKYYWDGNSTLTLAVLSQNLYIFNLNPKLEQISLVKILDELYLDVPYAFYSWPARSIYDLGQAENPPFGGQLLRETLGNTFGIPIDGYILVKGSQANPSFDKTLETIRQNPIQYLLFLRNIKTDLTLGELLSFWSNTRKIHSFKIKVTDLEKSSITKWQVLPDGSRILSLDNGKIDQFSQTIFKDNTLSLENYTIAIFNSTGDIGLAEKAARIIGNSGGRVILTSNWDEVQKESRVFGRTSLSKARLTQIFAPYCIKSCAEIPNLNNVSSRADIILILGEDFAQKFQARNK